MEEHQKTHEINQKTTNESTCNTNIRTNNQCTIEEEHDFPPLLPLLVDEVVTHLYQHNTNIRCKYNKFGQCIHSFRYFCSCGYGTGGMLSLCQNIKCSLYRINTSIMK